MMSEQLLRHHDDAQSLSLEDLESEMQFNCYNYFHGWVQSQSFQSCVLLIIKKTKVHRIPKPKRRRETNEARRARLCQDLLDMG
uniref:Uncharacterized protein n=1 Tax=Acrobeloides nanus TaxID=290746 RepID=A0A914CGM7_9BILA